MDEITYPLKDANERGWRTNLFARALERAGGTKDEGKLAFQIHVAKGFVQGFVANDEVIVSVFAAARLGIQVFDAGIFRPQRLATKEALPGLEVEQLLELRERLGNRRLRGKDIAGGGALAEGFGGTARTG